MKVGGGEAKSITTALLVLHRSSTGYHSEIFFIIIIFFLQELSCTISCPQAPEPAEPMLVCAAGASGALPVACCVGHANSRGSSTRPGGTCHFGKQGKHY